MSREGMSTIEQRAMRLREANLASNPTAGWGQALLTTHNFRLAEDAELGEWPRRHYTEQARATASANMTKVTAELTTEQRSQRSKQANATMGPEKRTAKALKSAKTRRGYSVRSVPCPYCGAQENEVCTTATDRELPNYHTQRREAARAWAENKLKP
jgi:hypothetical protein